MVRYHHYTAASHEFLRKAHEELAQGDLVQASEKGWGAAAQMVKAIAEQRGWRHNSHPRLHQIVDTLVKETGDSQIFNLFQVAGYLHTNFYENWQTDHMIESGLRDVQILLEKLDPLLEQV